MAYELRPGSPPRGEPEQNADQQDGDHQYAQNNGHQEAIQDGPAQEEQQNDPPPAAERPQLENAAEPDEAIVRVVEEILLILLREVAVHELLMELAVGDHRFVVNFGNARRPRVNGENGLFQNGQVIEVVEVDVHEADVQNEQPPQVEDEVLGGGDDDDGHIHEPNVEIVEFPEFRNEVRDQGYDGDLEDNV